MHHFTLRCINHKGCGRWDEGLEKRQGGLSVQDACQECACEYRVLVPATWEQLWVKVTQFSVWLVLTKVKKTAEGRASEDRLARASMSAT